MKQSSLVAQILNVRIQLDDGFAQKIDVINVCDDNLCLRNKCIDTDETYDGNSYTESVSYITLKLYKELLPNWMRDWQVRVRYQGVPDMDGHRQKGERADQRQLQTVQLHGLLYQHTH